MEAQTYVEKNVVDLVESSIADLRWSSPAEVLDLDIVIVE